MATKIVTFRCQEEQMDQMSHGMEMSSQIKKKKFKSSDETASLSEFYPIISGDVMSVKEILTEPKFPRHRTWEALRETMSSDELRERDQWTLFGNEAEKLEIGMIKNQRVIRERVDRLSLRTEAQKKASVHMKFIEDLSLKSPDFSVPLRPHTVWTGMEVKLSCSVQGCPTPSVTWYKDGVPLKGALPWNYKILQKFGLNILEIRRCSLEDAGEYKVIAVSSLGEAKSCATLTVNSHKGAEAKLQRSWTPIVAPEPEAQFGSVFPPTFVKEGLDLFLQCSFTSALLSFQQDVMWFRDGLALQCSSRLDFQTGQRSASLTLKSVQKEHEGLYTVRLHTWDGTVEHSAFVYVKDASAAVVGAPASPLQVKCSDVNRDYVFLSWTPPSADGAAHVQGYFIERCDIGVGKWERCNDVIQKPCLYPVTGLKENTTYQFRVCGVNQAGVGRPSKPTEPVLTSDPLEPSRTMVVKVERGREIVITRDQLEGQVRVPFPPTEVRVCELSDTYAVLSWTEPEPRGREPLTYFVERSIAGKESWHLASMDLTVLSTRFAAFDQQKGKWYSYRIRSVNKFGISEPSLPSAPVCLGQPLGVPASPHDVLPIRDSDTSVLIQWKEPKITKGILGYYLYCSEVGSGQWKTVNNKPITKTRFTVHGLSTNKQFVFRVKSVGLAGNSVYSDESPAVRVKSAKYVPSCPSAITVLNCTGDEMLIGWRAPANHGGDPVCGYYLDQRQKSQETWREVNIKPITDRTYKVTGLQEGSFYQFRVFAANIIGLGKPSEESAMFLCEPWTMAEPGCPYDLEFREVRCNSVVMLWAEPLYKGQSEISGYIVEISEGAESEDWTPVTKEPVTETHLKVSGLQSGQTFRLRVSAVNSAGVGMSSVPSEAVKAQTEAGTKEIQIGVDNDGFIFLSFQAPDADERDFFKWNKNYREAIDAGRARLENKNDRSVLTFTDPTQQDLGMYTVELSGHPDVSSSFTFTAEDLDRLTELSWHIRNPLIALKSGWKVDVSEQGHVRLWLQTESLSDATSLRLILNDREISSTPARKVNFDKAKGLVEIMFDQLSKEDEGSYTAQFKDGRAKNQFTLVFVEKTFQDALAKSEANRWNWKRKSGPHFEEYLSWTMTSDCEMIMKCKVTNINKDTQMKWFKDGVELTQAVLEPTGVSTLIVPQVTRKEAGVYRVVVSDGRGEDESVMELLDDEFESLMQKLSKQCALSAGPVRIQCTAGGFKLYCSLKYYLSYMKTSWHFKEKRIDQQERTSTGSSMQKVWIEIFSPTENDKGKYTLEMFDGQETHCRSLDLSGQAFADALLEHHRLKQVEFAEKNRARVTKGLPDVVAIMEDKSLCLTCFADGDPAPEMFWLKNDRELTSSGQYTITYDNKSSTLTINHVTMDDSGNYSIFVRNKFGSQAVLVTVSVYKHGEKPRADAVEM
ncbi:myomesin-3 isoform X1 [Triplophysa dalaica]|uniref:myomesin-3 isoform X1 n=1 Tax=Triplophysa dalaica TaxID=1582913 RepID=UPI0024DFA26D|nr:myomesin-3 isoform X1 [Triplophysa dalaica]